MPYTTDQDLLARRPDILQLGVESWTAQHAEATRQIDRALDIRWYRQAALRRGLDPQLAPFAPARLLAADTQLTDLAACKTLQLAYDYLAKGGADDTYAHLANHYSERYRDELEAVLAAGLDYDWDASDDLSDSERASRPQPRILQRL